MGFTVRGDLVRGILFSFCYGIEELFIDFVAAVYYKDHRFFPSFVTNSTIQLFIRFVKFDSCAIVVE